MRYLKIKKRSAFKSKTSYILIWAIVTIAIAVFEGYNRTLENLKEDANYNNHWLYYTLAMFGTIFTITVAANICLNLLLLYHS